MNAESYLESLQSLLPTGYAWTTETNANLTKVLEAIAREFARVDARTTDLLNEADPRTTLEMMADWETSMGLPDLCTGLADTLQERRLALVQKIINVGGQSKEFFYEVATALGYQIEIQEYRPFRTGRNRCGDLLGGPNSIRHNWRVKVPDARLTRFRTGSSRCGEKLGSFRRAEDLECVFRHIQPAHTNLIFAYEGV